MYQILDGSLSWIGLISSALSATFSKTFLALSFESFVVGNRLNLVDSSGLTASAYTLLSSTLVTISSLAFVLVSYIDNLILYFKF